MNEATKVKIIGGLVVVGTALAGYLADLAAQGQFGMWSAVVGALAGAALTYLASKKAMTMLALFVAFILPLGACQAACRHLTPMPERYPATGERIVTTLDSELDNFWSKVPRVQAYGVTWDCENNSGQCWSSGDKALATFDRRRHAWVVERAWRPVPMLFDLNTGSKLP